MAGGETPCVLVLPALEAAHGFQGCLCGFGLLLCLWIPFD